MTQVAGQLISLVTGFTFLSTHLFNGHFFIIPFPNSVLSNSQKFCLEKLIVDLKITFQFMSEQYEFRKLHHVLILFVFILRSVFRHLCVQNTFKYYLFQIYVYQSSTRDRTHTHAQRYIFTMKDKQKDGRTDKKIKIKATEFCLNLRFPSF